MRVHKNLNTGRWIVTDKRRTLHRCGTAVMHNARFVVSEKTRQYCISHRSRSVHAWAEGTVAAIDRPITLPADARRATYNPFRAATFHDAITGAPLTGAAALYFTDAGMYYTGGK